jgi:hypothetical protein
VSDVHCDPVPDGETAGYALGETTETLTHALTDRLERPEAVARGTAWMPTHSAEQWSMAMNTAA